MVSAEPWGTGVSKRRAAGMSRTRPSAASITPRWLITTVTPVLRASLASALKARFSRDDHVSPRGNSTDVGEHIQSA